MSNNVHVTLLTKEEYIKYKDVFPHLRESWWLRTPSGAPKFAYKIQDDGRVGNCNVHKCLGVRPAIRMPFFSFKPLNPGDKIKIGRRLFTVLSWDGFNLFALCNGCIAKKQFDPNDNQWESSEIKKWLQIEGLKLIF